MRRRCTARRASACGIQVRDASFAFPAQSGALTLAAAASVDDPSVRWSQARRRRQGRVLLAAAALYAAVLVALELDQNAGSGLSILYLVPVVLIGVELG